MGHQKALLSVWSALPWHGARLACPSKLWSKSFILDTLLSELEPWDFNACNMLLSMGYDVNVSWNERDCNKRNKVQRHFKDYLKLVDAHRLLFLLDQRFILEAKFAEEDICIIDSIHNLVGIESDWLHRVFVWKGDEFMEKPLLQFGILYLWSLMVSFLK